MRFVEQFDQVELRVDGASVLESESTPELLVVMEAIHVGPTRNFTRYSSEELRAATPTWTTPYEKPVLLHHFRLSDPAGRIKEAVFGHSVKGDTECITLKAAITDQEVIKKVKDMRYLTVSVGGEAKEAVCSICGTNRAEKFCEHERGRTYDGRVCYFDMKGITFDEISFVNVPADPYAGIVGIGESVQEARAGDDPSRPKGKTGKPIGKMKTGTQKQAYYGHNLLHGMWRNGSKTWTREQIKDEHTRVVRIILDRGWRHTMIDGLDDTLPEDLKRRSIKKGKKQQ